MGSIICGIDPGLAVTGYAVVRVAESSATVLDAGVCRFDRKLPLAERLVQVESDVCSILVEHRPGLVAVENLYAHYKHPRTAILMGHARGVILYATAKMGVKVRSYAATQVKRYLTGNGRATKSQVQRAVQTMLGLDVPSDPDDVADALALALCAAGDLSRHRTAELLR